MYALRELVGGALTVLASCAHDLANPQLVKVIRTRQRQANGTPNEQAKCKKVAWGAMKPLIGERLGSMHNRWAP